MVEYSLDYFILKYESLDASWFCLSTEKDNMDAYEWLTDVEAEALFCMVKPWGILTDVNDGIDGYDFFGDTIKGRIINFLKHIKEKKLKYV
jgi:hypothetical protein